MNDNCYNCDFIGEFDWFWLITDSKDDSIGHATHSMNYEESKLGDIHTEVYYCPNCHAEQ